MFVIISKFIVSVRGIRKPSYTNVPRNTSLLISTAKANFDAGVEF